MRKALVIAAGVIVLAVVIWSIAARERIVTDGKVVLLDLAPIDPRSLMQGDYMALRFAIAAPVLQAASAAGRSDGRAVVHIGSDGVGTFRRLDDGTALAPDEIALRYRLREGQVKIATNAFFFEEGRASDYTGARYGELRVADGDAILTRLRNAKREPMGH